MLTYTCTVIGYLWKKFPESISKFDFNMLTYTCTVIVRYVVSLVSTPIAVEKGFTYKAVFPLPFLIGSGQVGMQT